MSGRLRLGSLPAATAITLAVVIGYAAVQLPARAAGLAVSSTKVTVDVVGNPP